MVSYKLHNFDSLYDDSSAVTGFLFWIPLLCAVLRLSANSLNQGLCVIQQSWGVHLAQRWKEP